jgi:hypothetical protein
MRIAAIDIGYNNMGVVISDIDKDWNITEIIMATKIDIQCHIHKKVPWANCNLHHSRNICDLVNHFIQEYDDEFTMCDHVLIERQPPVGFTNIEALLMNQYRDKVTMISPRSMHKMFDMGRLSYETRKLKTEQIASIYLVGIPSYDKLLRKHDVADAFCMILFFIKPEQERIRINKLTGQPFEKFRMQSRY